MTGQFGCFDAHSDIPYSVGREHAAGRRSVISEEFLPAMREGGITMRVVATSLDDGDVPEAAVRRTLNLFVAMHTEVEATPELELAETGADVRRGVATDAVTLVLGMEGAEPLATDLSLLDAYHRLGLRVLTLTHSRRNTVGDGVPFYPRESGTTGGLSAFGVEVVERLDDLGIVVDVSHLNEAGFWDVMEYADGPVVASHSNARALYDHPRNLTDEQIEAVGETGGVVGINALDAYLAEGDATLDDVLDHVERVVDLVGVEGVGFGFDFYEYNLQYLSSAERERLIDVTAADGLDDDAAVGDLGPALRDRGFSADATEAVLLGNFARVFETVLPAE
jgi:membrane dipeptidase